MSTDKGLASEASPETVDGWIASITDRIVAVSNLKSDRRIMVENLKEMRPATVAVVHHAINPKNASSAKLAGYFKSLIAMKAEESLLCHARFQEVHQVPMSMSVNKSMVFKYLDAPLMDDATMPFYVAKAQALCAVANTFWEVTGNVNRVREIDQMYPQYVELFTNNPERALEMALLMGMGKITSIPDLKYHLELHPAINGGEL